MITIKGVIGLDIIGINFANMVSRLSGDIDIEIDSPGGLVSDGISIFNALKRYDKGRVNIHVVGECSSMAAYIMLAGDSLKFEPNSIVVLHNPWSCGCGDYRAMMHEAEILEKMTKLYAGEFVKKGIFDEQTIRSYMDNETWFIGAQDLKLLGDVAERDIPAIEDIEKEARGTSARNNIKAWQSKIRRDFKENLDGIAALISDLQSENIEIESQKNERKDNIMDEKELQQNHPELYAKIINKGEQNANKRINALMQFIDDDKETVIKAINEGKSIQDEDVFATLTRAKINANTIKALANENPPEIIPHEPVHESENPQANQEESQKEKEARIEKEAQEILAKIGL